MSANNDNDPDHYSPLAVTCLSLLDPSHKNYVSQLCYPLPVLPAYAWGGGYVLSSDLSGHLAASIEVYRASVLPRSCRGNIEDVQIGLFMLGLGVRPAHTPRFASVLR